MIRMARLVVGAVVVGLAATVGCLIPSHYSDEGMGGYAGQGGATTTATSSSTGGTPCTSASACDDGFACTAETCTNGSCVYVPLDQDPGPGSKGCMAFKCDNGVPVPTTKDGDRCGVSDTLMCVGAVCTGCTAPADCGKTDECEKPTCQPDMTCTYDYTPAGTKVVNAMPADIVGDCMTTTCDGSGNSKLTPDALDVPTDEVCSDGQCVNGAPVQTPLALGTPCAGGTTFCNANKTCVTCTVNAGCAPGKTCYEEKGCVSCSDGVRNGGESDIDCGGPCGVCDDKKKCDLPADCKNLRCENNICVSCSDGVKNGDEVNTDCGGLSCSFCKGTSCGSNSNCAQGLSCADSVCCDDACAGACKGCNFPGMVGTCSNLALGADDSLCAANEVCQGGGCVNAGGKKANGKSCTLDTECFSMNCVGTPPAAKCQ